MVGTAGWSVGRSNLRFSSDGSALERYTSLFSAVEVNSSFYRRHKAETWQRWRDAVPEDFKFSVKLPKIITHERRLIDVVEELNYFFADVGSLGTKLGAVLVQLPPNLPFEGERADAFFHALRFRSAVPVFVEPRHATWAGTGVSDLLARHDIRRVYADPQTPELRRTALANGAQYIRLHGSPKIYYSAYADEQIAQYAKMLQSASKPSWCIFDNTASGAALDDALKLFDMVH
jgi:uncharacterized protein YecE (DUF72 family)